MKYQDATRLLALGLVWLWLFGAVACPYVPPDPQPPTPDPDLAKELEACNQRIDRLEEQVELLRKDVEQCRQEIDRVDSDCREEIDRLKAQHQKDLERERERCDERIADELEKLRTELAKQERRRLEAVQRRHRERTAELKQRVRVLGEQIEGLEAASTREVVAVTQGDPIPVALFYGTNRRRIEAPAEVHAGRLKLLSSLPLLPLGAFFLFPFLYRKLLKERWQPLFVNTTRVLCGVLLVLLGYAAIRHLLIEPDAGALTYGNRLTSESQGFAVGTCTVSTPPSHQRGSVEDLSLVEFRRDPLNHFILTKIKPIDDTDGFFDQLSDEVQGGDLFVFVHGYNNSFTDVAFRTAQIYLDLRTDDQIRRRELPDVTPMFFSWPSGSGNYLQSENRVDASVDALAAFLEKVLRESDAANVRLLAHSMGSRVLTRAVERLVDEEKLGNSVDELILAAPDIPVGGTPDIAEDVKHMTVFASSKDLALLASKIIHGEDGDRLGQAPPVEVLDGANVKTIDVSEVSSGHSYVADSGRVLDYLRYLLTGKRSGLVLDETNARKERAEDGGEYWVLLDPD